MASRALVMLVLLAVLGACQLLSCYNSMVMVHVAREASPAVRFTHITGHALIVAGIVFFGTDWCAVVQCGWLGAAWFYDGGRSLPLTISN